MPIVLYRVDERLIHGQVVLGWGSQLHPDRLVVVDDELAESVWEQELYGLGMPENMDALFTSVEAARDHLEDWRRGGERIVLLTRDLDTMYRMARGGLLQGEEVNIGGIHYAPGRRAVLPYVFLGDRERADMARLAGEGAAVSARDVPGARRVDAAHLLRHDSRSA